MRQKHEFTYQIPKAAMVIKNIILTKINIPESYMQTLPKHGYASVGDAILHVILRQVLGGVPARLPGDSVIGRGPGVPRSSLMDLMESNKNSMLASRADEVLLCLKK